MRRLIAYLTSLALGLSAALSAAAGEVTVAVASNFLATAEEIARAFEAETGHTVLLVHGSTGKLYAQIAAGAPYDLFLAADAARPARLAAEGHAAQGPRTYATGRLALVSRDAPDAPLAARLADNSRRVAIANPATAPYGAAAAEVLGAIRGDAWRGGVVIGENVGQAFAFVATGNAPLGLVALAQARDAPGTLHVTEVPAELHAPIRQDAVLLARAAEVPAARAFWAFLARPETRARIAAAGYGAAP